MPQPARRALHSPVIAGQLPRLPVIAGWTSIGGRRTEKCRHCQCGNMSTPPKKPCRDQARLWSIPEAGFLSHKNPCRWLSTGLLRRCHKSSTIVFLPQFDEENAQMSRLDAFSLNTVPSIVLRKHRYILSKHIFIKSSSHLQAGMLQKRESQKLNIFS